MTIGNDLKKKKNRQQNSFFVVQKANRKITFHKQTKHNKQNKNLRYNAVVVDELEYRQRSSLRHRRECNDAERTRRLSWWRFEATTEREHDRAPTEQR